MVQYKHNMIFERFFAMKTKNSKKFFLALVIFSLTGQIAWVVENMYFNVFIYKMFGASAADISLMVAASAVSATLTTLLIGALSDKLGKRKVFICGGYILWGISILSFCLIRTDIVGAFLPAAAYRPIRSYDCPERSNAATAARRHHRIYPRSQA